MKRQAINELKLKSAAELAGLLKEAREKLSVMRFDLAAGKVKDIAAIRDIRKRIARIMTFIKEAHMKDETTVHAGK